jgi:hypothetical protein
MQTHCRSGVKMWATDEAGASRCRLTNGGSGAKAAADDVYDRLGWSKQRRHQWIGERHDQATPGRPDLTDAPQTVPTIMRRTA